MNPLYGIFGEAGVGGGRLIPHDAPEAVPLEYHPWLETRRRFGPLNDAYTQDAPESSLRHQREPDMEAVTRALVGFGLYPWAQLGEREGER